MFIFCLKNSSSVGDTFFTGVAFSRRNFSVVFPDIDKCALKSADLIILAQRTKFRPKYHKQLVYFVDFMLFPTYHRLMIARLASIVHS